MPNSPGRVICVDLDATPDLMSQWWPTIEAALVVAAWIGWGAVCFVCGAAWIWVSTMPGVGL